MCYLLILVELITVKNIRVLCLVYKMTTTNCLLCWFLQMIVDAVHCARAAAKWCDGNRHVFENDIRHSTVIGPKTASRCAKAVNHK